MHLPTELHRDNNWNSLETKLNRNSAPQEVMSPKQQWELLCSKLGPQQYVPEIKSLDTNSEKIVP